jgi:CheY-like chemotaxis protein
MKQDKEFLDNMFQQCKDSIYVINDKLTSIQVATENLWSEINKKDFYSTQQIETIIRSVDMISSKIEMLEKSLSKQEKVTTQIIPEQAGKKFKILLAEDDFDTNTMVKVFLEKANMDVTTAKNGKIAFDFFKKQNFDLVITDVNMPEINGPQLKKIIRQIDTEIPILFITGYEKDSSRDLAKKDKNAYFLSKPFKQSDVIGIIEKALL